MSELKFIITGTAGVGKTTAIAALSDIPPVVTDAVTTDELAAVKDTTTVAFDFGEIILDEDTRVRIYGTPGQERFKFMWEILAEGALGLVILVDATRPDPLADLGMYVDNFIGLIEETGVAVGITRSDPSNGAELEQYYTYLQGRDIFCPVMAVDPRDQKDMMEIMDCLMSLLECS